MTLHITAFLLSFCSIFMKGFAQQNMIHKRRGLMLPTSWFLALAELFTAGLFVENFLTESFLNSIILALVIGTGGGLGCMFSMNFHSWITKKIYKWHK